MKAVIPAIFLTLALAACDRKDPSGPGETVPAEPATAPGSSPPAAEAVAVPQEFKVGEEEPAAGDPTPGERLDHAIERTNEGLETAKEKTEEGLRKAAEATGGGIRRLGEAIERKADEKSR